MTELKDNLLAHIQTGKINMKPKWHFMVRSISLGSGLLLTGLLSLYFMSLVFFVLRESGIWWTSGFGIQGLLFFITTSPWLLITITLIFLSTVYILIRHFGHNYRHHAIYSLIALVLLAILGTSLMHYFAIHDSVRTWSKDNQLGLMSSYYQDDSLSRTRDITPGKIIEIAKNNLVIKNREGTYTIFHNDKTRWYKDLKPTIGTHVMIFGHPTSSSTIEAKGIRPLPPPLEKHLKERPPRN